MARDRDPEGQEIRFLLDTVDLSGKRVVDIGAGAGFATLRYARFAQRVVAVEPQRGRLTEMVSERPEELARRVSCVVGDGRQIPLGSDTADVAIYSWSF
jgi:protein-L-isoaspartate O-methyltransferase